MGAAPSKIDDDKALALCQERKKFVREALDGRCNLAAAHFSYAESLRNTGIALRRFADPGGDPGYPAQLPSSAMSTSATPRPVDKTISHFSNSSPVSNQHVEMTDSFSPSPISQTRQVHVNHMKATRMALKIVREKPPTVMTATLESSSPKKPIPAASDPEESINYEVPSPPPPGTPPWDYFGLFQPVDDRYTLDNGFGHADDIRRLREEEGIPDLEEEVDVQREDIPDLEEEEEEEAEVEEEKEEKYIEQKRENTTPGDESEGDFGDSDEDDFDKSSKEPLVRVFKNRNLLENHDLVEDLGSDTEPHHVGPNAYETDESRTASPAHVLSNRNLEDFGSDVEPRTASPAHVFSNRNLEDFGSDVEPQTASPAHVFSNRNLEDLGSDVEPRENGQKETVMSHVATEESRTRTPIRTLPRTVNQKGVKPPAVNGNLKEYTKIRPSDFNSCLKEIEELFRKAAESGREVPRMLEADKVQFRPLTADEIARRSGASTFLMSFLTCCVEEPLQPQASAPVEVKYLTWQRSVSSFSSSSRIPVEETTKDDVDSLSSFITGGVYMNSGSHASTLDRLYAWERKLYDEVKASGTIRRNYDFKCKLLRQQESQAESQQRIDKTRAAVKDLHSRIGVAIQRIDTISKNIEEIRDNELQPQLEELIEGLIRMWDVMYKCHQHQLNLIQNASANGSMRFPNQTELQHQAALTLCHELNLLSTNFSKWISAHKSYLQSINKWIHKCVQPLQQKKRKKKQQDSLRRYGAPPIFATCEDWLNLFEDLPIPQAVDATKDLANVTNHFAPHQEKRVKSFRGSLSLPKSGVSGEASTAENRRSYDLLGDWNSNCDSFRSRLVIFLEKLTDFSHKSLDNYQNLINKVRNPEGEHYMGI